MKSSHSCCRKVWETLLHSRKLRKANSAAKNAKISRCRKMQKTLLHSRKLSQSCGKNWRKVPSAVEMENKPNFQHLPLDIGLSVCAQTSNDRMVP